MEASLKIETNRIIKAKPRRPKRVKARFAIG
jgi:hypothetical protein